MTTYRVRCLSLLVELRRFWKLYLDGAALRRCLCAASSATLELVDRLVFPQVYKQKKKVKGKTKIR